MRNRHIDISKGLAVLLVVLGHTLAFRYRGGWLPELSHIAAPLFIFLAGLFLDPHRSWRVSILRKADGLLKPYLVVLLGWGLVHDWRGELDWGQYLFGVLYGTGPTIVLVPLWFLPHLFVCLLAGALVLRWRERWQLSNAALCLTGLGLLWAGCAALAAVKQWPLPRDSLFAWLLAPHQHWPGLPFSLDLLPLTLVFLLAGHGLAAQARAVHWHSGAALAAIVLMGVCHYWGGAGLDLNRRIYHDPWLTTVFVLAGIYLVLQLAEALGRLPWLGAGLAYLGRHTLLILLLHLLVLRSLFRSLLAVWPDPALWQVLLVFVAGMVLSVGLIFLVGRSRLLTSLLLPVVRSRGAA